jgi:hypothetical protein
VQTNSRAAVVAVIAAIGYLAIAGGATGSAQAAATATCTWGGTPAAPTGVFTVSTPLTNVPSAASIDFTAVGQLGGDCAGRMTFFGTLDPGATCSEGTFRGTVKGLPGVVRFEGFDSAGVAPSRLYDKDGTIVGSENAQLLTLDNAPFTECGAEGFTQGTFSSVIELF